MTTHQNDDPYIHEGWPLNTPLDIRKGLTKPEGVNHKLRWGILTASAIASDWIKSLQDVPGAEVTAVGARDLERARAFAEAHGIPNAYDSYQAVCEDPDVDIVYIASKTWDHHRDLMTAINARKHILCEKPFTDTAEQAKEVFEAADKADVICWEGMWLRFFPAVEHARTAMARGDIGDLKVVQADYPDRVYALNPAITGFGADEMPLVVAAGRKSQGQPYANNIPFCTWRQPKRCSVAVLRSGRYCCDYFPQRVGLSKRLSTSAREVESRWKRLLTTQVPLRLELDGLRAEVLDARKDCHL